MDDVAVVAGSGREAPGADAPDRGAVGFDAFVAAHGPRLLRTAYLLTGDHGAAEDLLRETLVRAWDRWSRVSGADQPLAHVRRMLVNAAVSRWWALRLRQGGEHRVATPPERGTADPAGHDDEVWRLVATLPPRQRAVVVLAYYEDLADAQVAETQGCATGAANTQRVKALRALRSRLGEERSMSDLETRVRDELVSRAEDAGPWRVGGADLRRTAGERRARRRRRAAAVSVVVVAAAALAGSATLLTDPSPDRDPTRLDRTTTPGPDPSWTDVELTPDMLARAGLAVLGSSDMTTLISTRLPRSKEIVGVLVAEDPSSGRTASTVTFASTSPGAEVRRGTTTLYPPDSSLIAQPAYEGDRAVLVVALPAGLSGDTVVVTSSEPGQPLRDVSSPLENRLALVPISAPEAVTRLRVLRRGQPVLDTVPGGLLLGREVPRTVTRVVVSESAGRPYQPV